MFPKQYFPKQHFPAQYFPPKAGTISSPPPAGAVAMGEASEEDDADSIHRRQSYRPYWQRWFYFRR